jgi:hypothetical protein
MSQGLSRKRKPFLFFCGKSTENRFSIDLHLAHALTDGSARSGALEGFAPVIYVWTSLQEEIAVHRRRRGRSTVSRRALQYTSVLIRAVIDQTVRYSDGAV